MNTLHPSIGIIIIEEPNIVAISETYFEVEPHTSIVETRFKQQHLILIYFGFEVVPRIALCLKHFEGQLRIAICFEKYSVVEPRITIFPMEHTKDL